MVGVPGVPGGGGGGEVAKLALRLRSQVEKLSKNMKALWMQHSSDIVEKKPKEMLTKFENKHLRRLFI